MCCVCKCPGRDLVFDEFADFGLDLAQVLADLPSLS
jgi:hypothetical protein